MRHKVIFKHKNYILVEKLQVKPIWAQDWWPDCKFVDFENKSQAVKFLKSKETLGTAHQSTEELGKIAAGIKKELRELKLKRIKYEVPTRFNFKYFAWLLHKPHQLIVCDQPVSRFPLGWNEFEEDKETPPNRAYLKLWEVLVLNYIRLTPEDTAIDLGSSPGGWSWVLSDFCKKVYSVDRAELAPQIAARKNIRFNSGDAFAVDPKHYTDCTWLFSDIICTPAKLLSLVEKWHAESKVKNFVCTIKFKGDCDFDILKEFLKFSDSHIIHLYQNKNEVTWIKQEKMR